MTDGGLTAVGPNHSTFLTVNTPRGFRQSVAASNLHGGMDDSLRCPVLLTENSDRLKNGMILQTGSPSSCLQEFYKSL
jgi:hypothetical protein